MALIAPISINRRRTPSRSALLAALVSVPELPAALRFNVGAAAWRPGEDGEQVIARAFDAAEGSLRVAS